MYVRTVRLFVVVLVGLAGCAAATSTAPTSSSTTPGTPDSIAAALRTLRHASSNPPIDLEIRSPEGFARRHLDATLNDEPRARAAVWIAFGLANAAVDPELPERVRLKQAGVYYDWSSSKLVSPGRPKLATLADEAPWAHEATHALQDRVTPKRSTRNGDVALAQAAFLEADATVTMLGYLAARRGKSADAMMLSSGELLHQLAPTDLPTWLGVTEDFSRAPTLWRDQARFQALGGVPFVVTVLREGGVALLDRVLRRPPRSTEQLLHPTRYFAGDEPIDVSDPSPPPGTKVRATGTLGELGIATLLFECTGGRDMARAGEGWGGDRFLVVERSDQKLALLWSTVWDREEDAIAFESMLRLQTRCWKPDAIETTHSIVRKGAKVALVRGLAAAEHPPLIDALWRLAAPRAVQRRPFRGKSGEKKLSESEKLSQLQGDAFSSEYYGVGATLPPGWVAQVQKGPMLVLGGRARQGDRAGVAVSLSVIEQEPSDGLFPLLAINVQRIVGRHRHVRVAPLREFTLNGLSGRSETFTIVDPVRHYRYHALSICNGTTTLLLHEEWGISDDLTEIDAWEKSITYKEGAIGCEPMPEYEHSNSDGRD